MVCQLLLSSDTEDKLCNSQEATCKSPFTDVPLVDYNK